MPLCYVGHMLNIPYVARTFDDDHRGVFEKYNVKVMGTPLEAIIATEDREVFAQELVKINEKIAPSVAARSLDEALKAAEKIGNDSRPPERRTTHTTHTLVLTCTFGGLNDRLPRGGAGRLCARRPGLGLRERRRRIAEAGHDGLRAVGTGPGREVPQGLEGDRI